jgi:hypothetical protein
MKAIAVYESMWGNTAAIARAIAEGIGGGTQALSTAEATGAALAGVDLIVAGGPLQGFTLPSEKARRNVGASRQHAKRPPDLSHPAMRTWMEALPPGQGRAAAFETGFRWSPGSATKHILRGLADKGYAAAGKGQRFIVTGTYGPLRAGEVERARAWGAELARTAGG